MSCLDCGRPSRGHTRCEPCALHHRGTTTERGYGAAHQRARRDPAYLAASYCSTCGQAFTIERPKTAGHNVDIRHGGRDSGIFAQCAPCNFGWRGGETG